MTLPRSHGETAVPPETEAVLGKLQRAADDPMWANHAEVNKSVLVAAINTISRLSADRRKYSLLESQFANCHKEIARLRAALLATATDDHSEGK